MDINRLRKLAGLNESSLVHIDQDVENGSLSGYVVDTDQEQLEIYLSSHGIRHSVIKELRNKITRIGIIKNMWIDEEHRSQGSGNELMSGAIDAAYEAGAEAIILIADLGEVNEFDLVKWYEGFGFEIIDKPVFNYLMILDEA